MVSYLVHDSFHPADVCLLKVADFVEVEDAQLRASVAKAQQNFDDSSGKFRRKHVKKGAAEGLLEIGHATGQNNELDRLLVIATASHITQREVVALGVQIRAYCAILAPTRSHGELAMLVGQALRVVQRVYAFKRSIACNLMYVAWRTTKNSFSFRVAHFWFGKGDATPEEVENMLRWSWPP